MAVLLRAAVRRNLYADGNTSIGFFLRMAHGESITTYVGQKYQEDPFQGLFQGNGTSPAGWVVVISVIIQHKRSQGHGSKVTKCISLSLLLLVDLQYVDDGGLLVAA